MINLDAGPHGDWIKGAAVIKMINRAKTRSEPLQLLKERGWTEDVFEEHRKAFAIDLPAHLSGD